MADPLVWPLLLGVMGAILGSFIAALAIRWPAGRSVVGGRSACDGCGRTLRAVELVPLVSFLLLRGRCRTCGAKIDPRHSAIEAAAVLVGALAGWVAPGPVGIAGAVFGWLLLALAALDLAALWLPDRLTATLAIGGMVTAAGGLAPAIADRAIGGVLGFAVLWAVGEGYRRVRGRTGLGGGDPKLLAGIGLWLGWRMLPAVVLLACLVGLGWAAFDAARGRPVGAATQLPLGALMALAAYPAWLVMIGSTP